MKHEECEFCEPRKKLIDLQQQNEQMKSELRKWNTHPGDRLQQAEQQYKESGQSLAAAKVYINGLAHSLKHMEMKNEKLVEAIRTLNICCICKHNYSDWYSDDNCDLPMTDCKCDDKNGYKDFQPNESEV